MSLALYQLSAVHRALADALSEADIDEVTIADTLESMSGDLEAKAVGTAMVARNLEAAAEQIKAAEAEMAKRRKAIESNATRVRKYLLDNLLVAGITKVECPHFRISVRENPGAVVVDNEQQIPAAYLTDPPPPAPVPNKSLIKAALADGFDVPGCRLVKGKRLDIR
jgi:hypothetical protein